MYISSDTNIWIDFQVLGVPRLPLKLNHIFCMSKEALRDELLTPPGLAEQLMDSGLLSLELRKKNSSSVFLFMNNILRYQSMML